MENALIQQGEMIFREMMTHPVLFTHTNPKKMMILGDDNNSILMEALKHAPVTVFQVNQNPAEVKHERVHWLQATEWKNHSALDVIISTLPTTTTDLAHFYQMLQPTGIIITVGFSPFDLSALKAEAERLHTAGFHDLQLMHFPQPHFTTGWRTAFMALKEGVFKRVKEKKIYNKTFETHYYNFDVHNASLVLPEFIRSVLTK